MVRKSITIYTLLVVIAALSLALYRASTRTEAAAGRAAPQRAPEAAAMADRGDIVNTHLFRNIARRENPVVVSITTQSRIREPDLSPYFGPDDFFRRFFGGPIQPRERIQRASGSGFIIDGDGEILTNNHVVAGAAQIGVGLFRDEHRTYSARIIGRDPLTDSALIRLDSPPKDLQVATLGNSDELEPGDWVMAIGNPFQLGHTVTVGVISYRGRPFAMAEGRYQNMLQTDASINPGNSGGPLINVKGEVIGINSAILSNGSAGNIGIGFAVPINTVKTLLPQLRKGRVPRGRLGLQIRTQPLTDEEGKEFGLPRPEGALVVMVERDSPADRGGIRAGDVIVTYNGQQVRDGDQLVSLVSGTPAGTRVPITLYRNGRQERVMVTVEELQWDEETTSGADRGSGAGFGLSLDDVTPEAARDLRLRPGADGALVVDVEPTSAAAEAGIRRGDVILEINRQRVHSAGEASRLLRRARGGQVVFLLISRQGNEMFLTMRKE
jgi:Do/DeqQ family serine protease